MYIKSDFLGCLLTLLIFLLLLYLLKELWWLIVGILLLLIAFYWGRKIYFYIISEKHNKEAQYNPQMGEVYKICPFCNSKVRVTSVNCPNCGRALN